MFGIGMSEMLIILAVALLVFGPKKLPEIAKSIAKGLKEIRKAGDDLRSSVNFDLDDDKPTRRPRIEPRPSTDQVTEPAAVIAGSSLAVADQPDDAASGASTDGAPDHADADVWPKPAEGTQAKGSLEAPEPKADDDAGREDVARSRVKAG